LLIFELDLHQDRSSSLGHSRITTPPRMKTRRHSLIEKRTRYAFHGCSSRMAIDSRHLDLGRYDLNTKDSVAIYIYISRFIPISFADLRKLKNFCQFAYPAFVSKPAWGISDAGLQSALGEHTSDQVRIFALFCFHIPRSRNLI
jgi:hypothetical protein